MAIAELDRLKPPFRLVRGGESWFVEDAAGKQFGFCYFDATPFPGTGRMARLTPAAAYNIARLFAQVPELVARAGGTDPETQNAPRPEPGGA